MTPCEVPLCLQYLLPSPSFSRSFDWNSLVVALDDHEPRPPSTFGRRICGGAMRPPLAPPRFRFAGRLSAGGRVLVLGRGAAARSAVGGRRPVPRPAAAGPQQLAAAVLAARARAQAQARAASLRRRCRRRPTSCHNQQEHSSHAWRAAVLL